MPIPHEEFLYAQIDNAVSEWWKLACAGHTALYLCYRETNLATGAGGELRVFAAGDPFPGFLTTDPSFQVALPQRLPLNVDRARVSALITEHARRLPILPVDVN